MQDAIELLEDIRRLMELKGENPFKVRAYEKAAPALAGRDDLVERAKAGTLTELAGIGKGISEVLTEFLLQGRSSVRDELAASLPAGLIELTQIPGVGPKKAMQLIEELGITSAGELEYACRENRLLKLKGFGEKVQQKILDGICFMKTTLGQQRLVDAFPLAEALLPELAKAVGSGRVSETGAMRRRMETLQSLDFLIEESDGRDLRSRVDRAIGNFRSKHSCSIPIQASYSSRERFGFELARATATDAHWKALGAPAAFDAETEEKFYEKLGVPWIAPEMRETGEEVELARKRKLDEVLPWDGIRGVFHNHTTRSDGVATLEEMVVAAKRMGFSYIGISDHSQSAFYAQGLKPDDLLEQEKEIRKVQEKHPEIRIFWGVESDILADGSLDYEPSVLKRFDFVIASIHSRFKMDRETMTQRVLEAIRNPYTRFIGHITGRLLLGRPGYELDMEKVIAEAAKRDVAIEINAHPARLDIDWRWGPALRREQTMVSVNPDAHEVAGLEDCRYGVAVARKALLPSRLRLELALGARGGAMAQKKLTDGEAEKRRIKEIIKILWRTYPEAECSLDFKTPFQLLVATILSAQCTDVRVNKVTPDLFARYGTPEKMAKASLKEIEGLIQTTGFFRSKALSLKEASTAIVNEYGGEVPRELEKLVKLRGVGRKTANVLLGVAFGIPGMVVDTHVGRLARRMGFTRNADPVKVEHDLMEVVPRESWTDLGHLFIHHGRAICTARRAYCEDCPVSRYCPKVGV